MSQLEAPRLMKPLVNKKKSKNAFNLFEKLSILRSEHILKQVLKRHSHDAHPADSTCLLCMEKKSRGNKPQKKGRMGLILLIVSFFHIFSTNNKKEKVSEENKVSVQIKKDIIVEPKVEKIKKNVVKNIPKKNQTKRFSARRYNTAPPKVVMNGDKSDSDLNLQESKRQLLRMKLMKEEKMSKSKSLMDLTEADVLCDEEDFYNSENEDSVFGNGSIDDDWNPVNYFD